MVLTVLTNMLSWDGGIRVKKARALMLLILL
jgi:hypothetical protein